MQLFEKMEDFSELQNGKISKNIQFSENIGELTVSNSFENVSSDPNLGYVYYDKAHEIQMVKQPKDFQVNTDVKLFDRKLSSMYDENIEKNRELLIASGVTTNMSSLNTKENREEINLAKLKQRSDEVSEINNSGLVAKMRAKINDNKNQSET